MIVRVFGGLFAALVLSLMGFSALAGCGNAGASEPPVTSYDPAATSKMQLAVGIATLSFNSGASVAYGLDTVETLRQADGLSGTLYNVPMIIGPSSFYVYISTETGQQIGMYAGSDFGTNHITWATLNQEYWTGPPRGQNPSTTGAFGYGLCPCNSNSGPINGVTPLYQAFNLPIYGELGDLQNWYGGPPAYPAEGPSVLALGWEGYSLGFDDFAVTPVVGTYHLYAAVPPAYDTPQNPTPSPAPGASPTPAPGILAAGAQLTHLTGLPQFANPAFKPDGKGGGTIEITVPAGTTEAIAEVLAVGGSGSGICVQSHEADSYYTVVTHGSGVQALNLPDDIGPLTQSGQKTPTICPAGTYYVYAVGTDWPAYESSYPSNLSQLPRITGSNGQADVTTSASVSATYPPSSPAPRLRPR
ncbi:MAG TPA: hypothetical protein VFF63_04480 [Candidatus Babeliales bacterium]|nr:hypothetical protein [Candidatus Babeliales bacterium]